MLFTVLLWSLVQNSKDDDVGQLMFMLVVSVTAIIFTSYIFPVHLIFLTITITTQSLVICECASFSFSLLAHSIYIEKRLSDQMHDYGC